MRCGKCEKELYACKCGKKKDEPVIDESMAKRIATQLGWEPKREWVGLTDEDKKQIEIKAGNKIEMTAWEYAQRVGEFTEAKLKENNCR